MFSINTSSGGLIEIKMVRDRFRGDLLLLHVDQTANINNGEGDASVIITEDEIQSLISLLNNFLEAKTGKPYVVLAEPLLNPAVKIQVDFMEYFQNNPNNDENN